MEEIEHFDHPLHPLLLSNRKRDDQILCNICQTVCDGQTYIFCSQGCSYNLHESCAKQVQSPFHPHPLILQRREIGAKNFVCNACREYITPGFILRCEFDKCNFQIHVKCASMRPVKVKEEGQLHTYPHHQHPLLLFENIPNRRFFSCPVCGENCLNPDPTYGCAECGLYLHPSCFEMNLRAEIQHHYHSHPLILSTTPSNAECKACHEKLAWVWYYSCKQCKDFVMHIDCTLSAFSTAIDEINSESRIHHVFHVHPLSLRENQVDNQQVKYCCACGKACSGLTTYVCCSGRVSCKDIYFHKSCLELPQHISHPFHPYHSLTLKLGHSANVYCNACRSSYFYTPHSLCYICEVKNCNFLLHVKCSVIMPSMQYEGHGHLLQFKSRDSNNNEYNNCNACKSKIEISESYVFTCLYCDLNLHFHCGPLPYSIMRKDIIEDPLLLSNSPVEEEVEDETDEFYCHVCEEERSDPMFPVYYSAKYHCVAEFKCVLPQIISLLNGEHGAIELRSTLGHHGSLISANSEKERWPNKFEQVIQTSNLSYILGSSWKDVREELSSVSISGNTITTEEDDDFKDSEYSEDFLLSDQAYTQFMKSLDHGSRRIPEPWKTREEFTKVEDYTVPLKVAPILRHLLSKHGDVGSNSKLSPMTKLYLFNVLCECMYDMTTTKVVETKNDLLLNWWTSIKMLEFAGFELQFAFKHLKRVTHAYYGHNVKRRVDDALKNINQVIALRSEEIETVKKKRDLIILAESEKSNKIKECLREASVLKYGKASTGLLSILQ
nr:hypothetical protein CFP56_56170 [Quercus suber]